MHRFLLRQDFEVELRLPHDLTVVEANQLSSFIRSLVAAKRGQRSTRDAKIEFVLAHPEHVHDRAMARALKKAGLYGTKNAIVDIAIAVPKLRVEAATRAALRSAISQVHNKPESVRDREMARILKKAGLEWHAPVRARVYDLPSP